MSDWELATDNESKKQVQSNSDWEIVPESQNSGQMQPKESIGTSLAYAIPRVATDLAKGAYNFFQNIPGYLDKAKTEVPGVVSLQIQHPGRTSLQALAGGNELINKIAQAPLNLAKYGANRLHILPMSFADAIQKFSPEDTTPMINKLFPQPQYPGEALARGAVRDIPELFGAGKVADFLNPLQYKAKNVANNIVRTGKEQAQQHTKMYNDLWSDANTQGFGSVPVDTHLLSNNLDIIKKYKTKREYQSLEDMINNPSLPAAQKAQSDMGIMKRNIEQKSRTNALTSEEQALYQAASESEKHIENNMFKNQTGQLNQALKDRYDRITSSYRENVVPYRYNSDIQAYINKELLAKQLKQRLSLGEFAAKKGKEHPELFRGEQIRNALIVLGIGTGSLVGGKEVLDHLYGQK